MVLKLKDGYTGKYIAKMLEKEKISLRNASVNE